MGIVLIVYTFIAIFFLILSLIIIYHLFRFGVNKSVVTAITAVYVIVIAIFIINGFLIAAKL